MEVEDSPKPVVPYRHPGSFRNLGIRQHARCQGRSVGVNGFDEVQMLWIFCLFVSSKAALSDVCVCVCVERLQTGHEVYRFL